MSQCECGQEIFDEECVHLSDAFTLVEPTGDDRIPAGHLAYFTARNRRKIYSAVIKAFKDSGLTQIQLAKRLGKRPDVICHWLSGPGNWEIDTVSILLFGISGGELGYRVVHPLRRRIEKRAKT